MIRYRENDFSDVRARIETHWLCTDCQTTFLTKFLRAGKRCPYCGGARTIEGASRIMEGERG